jgi:hypothetical protein
VSIVTLLLAPDAVEAVCDAAWRRDGRPCGGASPKIDALPHLRALVGFCGTRTVRDRLRALLDDAAPPDPAPPDVAALAGLAAAALPGLLAEDRAAHGEAAGPGEALLLAGWSPARGRMLGFRWRSWTGAGPEALADGAHGEPDALENWQDVITRERLFAAVGLQIAELRAGGVPGGGELFHYALDAAGTLTVTVLGRVTPEREAAGA